MTIDAHRDRTALAREQLNESLVDLLLAHVDEAYVTAGLPGALTAMRDLLRRMDPEDLRAMVYDLGLETEPVREGDMGEPKPREPA